MENAGHISWEISKRDDEEHFRSLAKKKKGYLPLMAWLLVAVFIIERLI